METKHFGNLEVRIFNDYEEMSRCGVKIFADECKKTLKKKEIFTVSLCGGSTPRRLFELSAGEFRNIVPWRAVHIFFGDEREGKDNPESNFQIAYQPWLKEIIKEIPSFEKNIHRIKMELGLVEGAKEYEKEIDKFAPDGFDLSLSGVGSDGHRNGIFPEGDETSSHLSPFAKARGRKNWKNGIWELPESVKVYGYEVPPEINPHKKRITLTPWFLNKSKVNILMIFGKDKAELLRKITIEKENYNKRELPAITFNDVPTIVLTDKLTAQKL